MYRSSSSLDLPDGRELKQDCSHIILLTSKSIVSRNVLFTFDRTRVVMLEFTIYNGNVDLFTSVIMVVEFGLTGLPLCLSFIRIFLCFSRGLDMRLCVHACINSIHAHQHGKLTYLKKCVLRQF